MYSTAVTTPATPAAPPHRALGIQIGARPESGFDDPLGLLSDCHRRIEGFLHRMLAVVEAQAARPEPRLTREECLTLAAALRYFREAAPLHTRDEEESLFPRLRAAGSRAARVALEALAVLEADHDAADALHAEADVLCHRWMADGTLDEPGLAHLWDVLTELHATYRRHIAVEDSRVFPLAARALSCGQKAEVGREMARRRGIDVDRLPARRFALRHAAA